MVKKLYTRREFIEYTGKLSGILLLSDFKKLMFNRDEQRLSVIEAIRGYVSNNSKLLNENEIKSHNEIGEPFNIKRKTFGIIIDGKEDKSYRIETIDWSKPPYHRVPHTFDAPKIGQLNHEAERQIFKIFIKNNSGFSRGFDFTTLNHFYELNTQEIPEPIKKIYKYDNQLCRYGFSVDGHMFIVNKFREVNDCDSFVGYIPPGTWNRITNYADQNLNHVAEVCGLDKKIEGIPILTRSNIDNSGAKLGTATRQILESLLI